MSARSMEVWLCDLGNSRAKLARLGQGAPVGLLAIDWTCADFVATGRAALAAWPRPDRIVVASVAPAARAAWVRELLDHLSGVEAEWLRSPRQACGIRSHYAKPERLGVDRFLSMVAVHSRAPGAAIVVGCGTALTLDAVAADGSHEEGMIALSPERMRDALRDATAIADSNPDAFADGSHDDTAIALTAGCRAAAGALVEWFATRQRAALGAPTVWLHGGWAEQLARWLAHDGFHAEVCEHAVLAGLAVWARDSCDHS